MSNISKDWLREQAQREVRTMFDANPRLFLAVEKLGRDERDITEALIPAIEALLEREPMVPAMRFMAHQFGISMYSEQTAVRISTARAKKGWSGVRIEDQNRLRGIVAEIERAVADGALKGGRREIKAWKEQLADPYRVVPLVEKKGVSPHTVFEGGLDRLGIKQGLARRISRAWIALNEPGTLMKASEMFTTKKR